MVKDQVLEITPTSSRENCNNGRSIVHDFNRPVDPNISFQSGKNDDLDTIVFQFDDQWNRHGYPQRIRAYLDEAHAHDRSRLARELVLIDIEYRRRKGDFKSFENYIDDYPEILEDSKYVPHKFILTLFELNWEWSQTGQRPNPEIRNYLLNSKFIKKPSDLFWKLARIDIAHQPNSTTGSRLTYYTELFRDLFAYTPVVPLEMIVSQFRHDWKSKKVPDIDTYVKTFLGEIQDVRYLHDGLTALVDMDMRERWKLGKPKWIEDYLDQFSNLLNSDGLIPEKLILREQSLSVAVDVSENQIRCPYCQSIHVKDAVVNDCSNCGRIIHISSFNPVVPKSLRNYQIVKLMGIGGYAKVYKAWDTDHQRMVAIKVPIFSNVAWLHVDRIQREVEIVSKLQNPNIVKIYDYHINENPVLSYVVYQYVRGPVLTGSHLVKETYFADLARLMATVADSVHYAHKNKIIHRDLKPRNILLNTDGTPVISDFGLARFSDYTGHRRKTFPGQLVGTVDYMSPEQICGTDIDYRTDIYSLGVVLYKLLTGRVPFRSKDFFELRKQICEDQPVAPSSIDFEIPEGLERICLRALAKEPWRRYATAADFAKDLKRYVEGKRVIAKPSGPFKRLIMWMSLNRFRTLMGVLFLSLFLTCTVLTYMII